MSFHNKSRIIYCIQILFGFFGIIASNQTFLDNLSPEEKISLFGTLDVPEYKIVRLDVPSRKERSTQFAFTINVNFNGIQLSTTLDIIVDEHLMSRNTGIWFAKSDPNAFNSVKYYPDPTVLERIGDVYFYQDLDNGSALTHFKDPVFGLVFTGIICQNYALKALPHSATNGVVIPTLGHAVKMRSASQEDEKVEEEPRQPLYIIFKIRDTPQENFRREPLTNGTIDFNPVHDRKKRQFNVPRNPPKFVYPKLLVPVDYGSIKDFKTIDTVKYLIAFWNAVDMEYRQLNDPAVRLHIAGFIIPLDGTASSYIAPDTTNMFNVNVDYVLNKMGLDFYAENQRIPHDTYNIIMAMTRTRLCTYVNGQPCTSLGGMAMKRSACRKSNWYYGNANAIGATGIAMFDWMFGGVLVTAHELGHVLGVDSHDGEGSSRGCNIDDGYTMVPGTSFAKTLRWSSCSIAAFKQYFNSADASCLRSSPTTMFDVLQSMAGSWLPVDGQCKNLQRNSQKACNLPNVADICYRYGCMVNGFCIDTSLRPLDGSQCPMGNYCKDLQCRKI